jgi:tetratricopeptide (TPR) repeat protein
MRNMAVFHWDSGNPDEAEPMLERALAIRKTALGENHPDTIDALAHLGLLHVKKGRVDRGLPLLESAYRGGSDFPEFRWVGRQLAKTYADTGRREEAVQVVHEQFETACAQLNENAPQLSNEMTNAGLQLLEIQAWPEAEAMMRNCLRVRQQQTPDSWRAFDARSMLGEALFHQQEYPEAELLLVEGYDGLNQRAESIPQNTYLTRALNRLIAFYDALENEDKAAFYRAELEAFDPDSP